jgi:hypothetical protein
MVSKSKYHKLAEAHKTISDGYKKLAKASEDGGIEYAYIPKVKTAGLRKR